MIRRTVVGCSLLLAFALELWAFSAIGYGAYQLAGSAVIGVMLVVVAVAAAVALWGLVAAPQARLRGRIRTSAAKTIVFAAATAALVGTGQTMVGIALTGAVILNALVLHVTRPRRSDAIPSTPPVGRAA